jgi:xylulokinase
MWRQLQADVFGQKVTDMVADEGPAYGVALLAAVGDGAYKNIQEACTTCVRTAGETKPSAMARKFYNRAFPIYQDLYGSLRNDFERIAALG